LNVLHAADTYNSKEELMY